MAKTEEHSEPTIQQEFWRNPRKVPKGLMLDAGYVECCKPEYYTHLKPVSEFIVKVVKAWAHKPKEEISILELGCNSGRNIDALLRAGFENVRGIEINPECLAISKVHFPRATKQIDIGSIEGLLPIWGEVDLIFTQGVLMHIPHENIGEVAFYASSFARRIITVEQEAREAFNIKFARNYREIFERFGMWQIYVDRIDDVGPINGSTMRVFDSFV